jgi:hypothetical protein
MGLKWHPRQFVFEQAGILGELLKGRYIKAADATKIGDVAKIAMSNNTHA